MLLLFGLLIYAALHRGERFAEIGVVTVVQQEGGAFELFQRIIADNLVSPLAVLLFQISVILAAVRIFSCLLYTSCQNYLLLLEAPKKEKVNKTNGRSSSWPEPLSPSARPPVNPYFSPNPSESTPVNPDR